MNPLVEILIAIFHLLTVMIIYSEERMNELTVPRKFSVFVILPMIVFPGFISLWMLGHWSKKPRNNQKKIHTDLGSLLVIAAFILQAYYTGA